MTPAGHCLLSSLPWQSLGEGWARSGALHSLGLHLVPLKSFQNRPSGPGPQACWEGNSSSHKAQGRGCTPPQAWLCGPMVSPFGETINQAHKTRLASGAEHPRQGCWMPGRALRPLPRNGVSCEHRAWVAAAGSTDSGQAGRDTGCFQGPCGPGKGLLTRRCGAVSAPGWRTGLYKAP